MPKHSSLGFTRAFNTAAAKLPRNDVVTSFGTMCARSRSAVGDFLKKPEGSFSKPEKKHEFRNACAFADPLPEHSGVTR
jgi:hypothetical protein